MISFIVSAYNRPWHLGACLYSLLTQEGENDILVCDNGQSSVNEYVTKSILGPDHYTLNPNPSCKTGYHGLEVKPKEYWLCFPTEDSYYVPDFSRIMLDTANKGNLEFVYCNALYDTRLEMAVSGTPNTYSILDTRPSLGGIDKTCFLVTRRAFEAVGGWPDHPADWRDGALAEKLVKAGIKHGKAPGVLVVKN